MAARSSEFSASYPGHPTILRPNVVQLTQDLIKIPSDKNSAQIVPFFEGTFRRYAPSLELERLSTGSKNNDTLLVGKGLSEGRMSQIVTMVHIDTVPGWSKDNFEHGPYEAVIEDGTLYGRGASDSKGPAAANACAVIYAAKELPKGYILALTSDEEIRARGALAVARRLRRLQRGDQTLKPELIIAGGNYEDVGHGSRGVAEGKVIFTKKKSGHSGHGGTEIDAITGAAEVMEELRELVNEMPDDEIFGNASLNFGGIQGGKYVESGGRKRIKQTPNMIADRAQVYFAIRDTDQPIDGKPLNPQTLYDIFSAKIEERGLTLANFQPLLFISPAMSTVPEKTEGVKDIVKDVTRRTHIPSWKYKQRGLEEAIVLLQEFGHDTPLIIWGPGKQEDGNYHSVGEHVPVQYLHEATEVYRRIYASPDFRS